MSEDKTYKEVLIKLSNKDIKAHENKNFNTNSLITKGNCFGETFSSVEEDWPKSSFATKLPFFRLLTLYIIAIIIINMILIKVTENKTFLNELSYFLLLSFLGSSLDNILAWLLFLLV